MPDLTVVPGVGKASVARLERLGIHDTDGLLFHLPRRYLDLRPVAIGAIDDDLEWVTVKGRVARAHARRTKRRGLCLAEAEIEDDTGSLRLVWFFQAPFRRDPKPPIDAGSKCIVTGRVRRSWDGVQLHDVIIHPKTPTEAFLPIYPLSEGLSQKRLRTWILWALDHAAPEETLPHSLLEQAKTPTLAQALDMAHRPSRPEDPEEGRRRLALGELYAYYKEAEAERRRAASGIALSCPESLMPIEEFERALPFTLTEAQRRALAEVSGDMERTRPMRRLLNGDVGSGKTVVAAYGALRAVLAGGQALFLAPTRLLAEQHQRTVRSLLSPWSVRVELIVAGMDAEERRNVVDAAANGVPMIVVGTHALLSAEFTASKAFFGVIDEQHRFGVDQRAALDREGRMHILAMSATPIPRTLAMALFAEMDVTLLDERPVGRKPVDTRWIHPQKREEVYAFVRKQVALGRQAYVVCPRVNPETGEEDDGAAAETFAARLASTWLADLNVGLVHGRMSAQEQETTMRAFCEGALDVLVSTTVIEVGVDVPNASVMVIERADLFGLAQLHQLRGRIGRGNHQSYCLLVTDPQTTSALRRVNVLRKYDDGRRIAEIDLAARGPGEFLGLRQSGRSDFRFVDFTKDIGLMESLRAWRAKSARH